MKIILGLLFILLVCCFYLFFSKDTFKIFKNSHSIVLLFASNIVSGFAQGITMIAIPWYFVDILDLPDLCSRFYLLLTFIILFWGLYAGTIVDRYPRKKVFIYTNLVCGLIIGSIASFGYYFGFIHFYLILLVFGVTIFNYNIHYPNLYAFGQEITDSANYGRLNSYIEIQGQVTSMFAGACAALLLTGFDGVHILLAHGTHNLFPFSFTAWDIHEVFLMDCLTYFIGIILFSFIRYSPSFNARVDIGSLFDRLNGGFSFLRKNVLIFVFGSFSYVLFAFTIVEIHVLLPVYVDRFIDASGHVYALSEFYYSIGAILAGFVIYKIFSDYNIYLSVILLLIIISGGFIMISIINNLYLFFFVMILLGLTNAGVRILRTTYLFNHVPNHIIGRVNSVFGSINVIIRMSFVLILSNQFFFIEDNIRLGYFVGGVIIIASAVFLFLAYRKSIK